MNLHPKVRPLWQRALILPCLILLMSYKALHLPKQILPRDLRSIVKHWDYKMFWVLIRSGLTRAYIDQPCEFKMPDSFEPLVQVAPEFQLKEKQIRQFYEDGFLGPFDAFSRDEMKDFRVALLSIENTRSKTYGFCTPRDRHFEMPRLWNYMKHPAITEPVAWLAEQGVSVITLPVDHHGMVSLADLADALTPHTRLVSIMHANNEIGTLQPIRQVSDAVLGQAG